MTREEKELLIKDLCTRLPYRVKIYHKSTDISGKTLIYDGYILHEITSQGDCISLLNLDKGHGVCEVDIALGEFKPYLRPMSSMTKEEENELSRKYNWGIRGNQIWIRYHSEGYWDDETECPTEEYLNLFDWLNKHHFDYRGLIKKGLALEAPKNMYNC